MDWLTRQEALDLLRVGDESAGIVDALCRSIPSIVEAKCGYPHEELEGAEPWELAQVLARMLLQLLFSPDGTDSDRLRLVVDDLSYVLSATMAGQGEQDG